MATKTLERQEVDQLFAIQRRTLSKRSRDMALETRARDENSIVNRVLKTTKIEDIDSSPEARGRRRAAFRKWVEEFSDEYDIPDEALTRENLY